MDPEYGDKLVDNPAGQVKASSTNLALLIKIVLILSLQQKKANQRLNDKRNREVKVGKKVLAEMEEGEQGDADNNEEGETVKKERGTPKKNQSTPAKQSTTPAKRKTPSKTQSSSKKQQTSQGKRQAIKADNNESPSGQQRSSATRSSLIGRDNNNITGNIAMHPPPPTVFVPTTVVDPRPYPHHIPEPTSHLVPDLQRHYLTVMTGELENILQAQGDNRSYGIVAELSRRYRVMICALLGVNMSWADSHTLGELRLYGRAYHHSMVNQPWRIRSLPEEYDAGYADLVWTREDEHGQVVSTHFSNVLSQFRPLALARGDVDPHGTAALNGPQYLPALNVEQMRALGLDENPLGMPGY